VVTFVIFLFVIIKSKDVLISAHDHMKVTTNLEDERKSNSTVVGLSLTIALTNVPILATPSVHYDTVMKRYKHRHYVMVAGKCIIDTINTIDKI
jgi:predicted dinucleotide-binding enzyme